MNENFYRKLYILALFQTLQSQAYLCVLIGGCCGQARTVLIFSYKDVLSFLFYNQRQKFYPLPLPSLLLPSCLFYKQL